MTDPYRPAGTPPEPDPTLIRPAGEFWGTPAPDWRTPTPDASRAPADPDAWVSAPLYRDDPRPSYAPGPDALGRPSFAPPSGPPVVPAYGVPPSEGPYGSPSHGAPSYGAPSYGPPSYGAPAPQGAYDTPPWWQASQPVRWPAPRAPRPPAPVAASLLVTLLLNWFLGGLALYHALRVDQLYDRGDDAGARRASDRARAWLTWATALGLAWVALVVLYFLIRG